MQDEAPGAGGAELRRRPRQQQEQRGGGGTRGPSRMGSDSDDGTAPEPAAERSVLDEAVAGAAAAPEPPPPPPALPAVPPRHRVGASRMPAGSPTGGDVDEVDADGGVSLSPRARPSVGPPKLRGGERPGLGDDAGLEDALSAPAFEMGSLPGFDAGQNMRFSLASPQFEVEEEAPERPAPLALKVLVLLAVLGAVAAYASAQHSVRWAGRFPGLVVLSSWGFRAEELLDLTGKTFVVTGASSGLGLNTARMLASCNATVLMACRNAARCRAAVDEVRGQVVNTLVEPRALDLTSLASVRTFAAGVARLDGLVLNAGMVPAALRLTEDGLEESFQVNYLAQWELARLLTPKLLEAARQRDSAGHASIATVAVVTSSVHVEPRRDTAHGVPLSLAHVNDEQAFDAAEQYAATKLAGILMVRELDRRFFTQGIVATAVHPGAMDTALIAKVFRHGRTMQSKAEPRWRIMEAAQGWFGWRPLTAALSVVAAVTRPQGHGQYTVPVARLAEPSEQARDADAARKLWDFSEQLVADRAAAPADSARL
jgi:NAD(P)-dependent dehydrogenase (short-subunit alcohol dehydrogenase family)